MKKWITKNGYTVCKVLGGRCNSYLIKAKDTLFLVDNGTKAVLSRLIKNIENTGNNPEKIDYFILTHTHFDHCQNTASLVSGKRSQIVISKKEQAFSEKGFTPLPEGTYFITRQLHKIGDLSKLKTFRYKAFSSDISIENDYEFSKESLNIKIISTPGHTDGSISVIVDDEIALVGDAMFGILPNTVFPPFANDTFQMVQSWKKLLNTGCKLFLPGHGRKIKRELLEKDYRKYESQFTE